MMRLNVTELNDPALAQIGWAAARRANLLFVVLWAGLPGWARAVAPLEAMTDDEYDTYHCGLSLEEQERRALIYATRPLLSAREALIEHRTVMGQAGDWAGLLLEIPEQRQAADSWEATA